MLLAKRPGRQASARAAPVVLAPHEYSPVLLRQLRFCMAAPYSKRVSGVVLETPPSNSCPYRDIAVPVIAAGLTESIGAKTMPTSAEWHCPVSVVDFDFG
jgi:hypothetical protein